jgi:ectoine hydroxylase-related dioxygenase (phytanoyl-CoA dioxygenase family)
MMDSAQIQTHADKIARDGYSIVERGIEPDFVDALVADLERLERELGVRPAPNRFEGVKTVRIYNLLVYGKLYERIPVHEHVLPIVERVLDDQLIPLAKPHVPIVCNSMWALTDFTAENGATRIIPGSHLRDHSPDFFGHYDSIPAEMPKGSVMIYNGSLWHGGGANRTGRRRVGVAMNYCAGYIRQQENQQLGIPREVAAQFAPRLQELIGYGVYNGLIGHIDKTHPMKLLGRSPDAKMVWDIAG